MLIDTHCHIHDLDYPISADEVIEHAHQAGVMQMICIGTSVDDSIRALNFAAEHDGVFASAGVHPEYADKGIGDLAEIVESADKSKLVAIGEIGLDYYNNHVPREVQIAVFEQQIELALKYDLPIIFHVRDAYGDFWSVIDGFPGLRGVLHCFTDTMENAQKGIEHGFYIAINGISTFTRDEAQKTMFAELPISKLLLETDAPYLTPTPLRGKIKVNEPAFIHEIAEYNSMIRQIKFDEIANATTANARTLFNL